MRPLGFEGGGSEDQSVIRFEREGDLENVLELASRAGLQEWLSWHVAMVCSIERPAARASSRVWLFACTNSLSRAIACNAIVTASASRTCCFLVRC
jgi:hypothetical protein